jgi:hypothetical protein
MLPPGDLRNCMVALSEEEDLLVEALRASLSRRQRAEGAQLRQPVCGRADGDHRRLCAGRATGVEDSGHAGRIYPATTANATLVARMDDGSVVRGETNITASKRRIVELTLDPPDRRAAAGDAGGHRARRPDHGGAGIALHLADHQSAGGRAFPRRWPGARRARLHLQPDDAGQREPGT